MNIESETNPEKSLFSQILERINNKKNAEVLRVYWETLCADIKNLAKTDIEKIPNAYVYLYSVSKMYLQNYSNKSIQKIEELYQFFHIIFNCLFNDDPAKLTTLISKDANIDSLLLKHFENYSQEGKTPKYIFDIILICLKSKDQTDSDNPFAPQILQIILKSSISDDDFLARKSQKLIYQILDLKGKTMPVLISKTQEFVFPILETWFIRNKEMPKILDLVKKTIPYFTQEAKIKIFEYLLPVSEGKSPIIVKIKVFEIVEIVFASSYFSNRFTQTVLENLIKIEDMFVQLLTDKRLVISFFKSRLQVLLNYYTLDSTAAKFYIPSFISSLFEFFATDTMQDLTQILQEEEDPKKTRSKGKPEQTAQVQATENNEDIEEIFSFYKRFSFKLFELLIENTFDYALFAELNPGSTEAGLNQITDLMNNLDLADNVNNFTGQTTIFRIFALINHVLTTRFSQNFSFTLRISAKMIAKISELGFRSSVIFNEQLAKFYLTVRSLLQQEQFSQDIQSQLEIFLSNVLCAGDLLIIIPSVFKITSGQQFDFQNLQNPDFVFFIHILSNRGGNYRFAAFYNYFIMVHNFAIELYLQKSSNTKMETENDEEEQFTKAVLDQKLEANMIQQIVSTLPKFDYFDVSDSESLPNYASFLMTTLFSERIYENPILAKHFITLLNSLLFFIINNKVKLSRTIAEQVITSLRTNTALAKICKSFIKAGKNSDKVHFENFLKLFAKSSADDHTVNVIIKNITRLENLIKSNDLVQQGKGVLESAIISSLLTGYDELSRKNDLYNLSLQFAQNLFMCQAPNAVKMGFKVLSGILTNIHQSQYPTLLQYVEELLNGFLKGQFQDKKFENNCLKFVKQLFTSYFVNLPIDEFRVKIQKFCEKYFNFLVFNFKNRNQKTRKLAQKVLSDIFQKYHEIDFDEHTTKIDENSFLICCLVSGLASETIVAKANCIEAIAFTLKEFGNQMTTNLIHSVMKVVVLLIKEKSHEVYTSALKFMTRILKKQDTKIIEDNLALIVEAVFEWDSESAKKSNNKLKNFISLLNRKYVI